MEDDPFSDPGPTLEESKQAFSQVMLANDTFFALVRKKLDEGDKRKETNIDRFTPLRDFWCEPVTRRTEDGNYASLKIEQSGGLDPTDTIRAQGRTFFFHIAIVDEDLGIVLNPSFVEDVKAVKTSQDDNEKQMAASVLETWKTAYTGIVQAHTEDLAADPVSGCLVFRSDLEDETGF